MSKPGLWRRVRRGVFVLGVGVVVLVGAAGVTLWYNQWQLIYVPKKEEAQVPASVAARTRVLEFMTSAGKQRCHLVRPKATGESGAFPSTIWLMFHGQYSTSIDLAGFAAAIPDAGAAAVLVEYPGFAQSEGRSNSRAIAESASGALKEAVKLLAADAGTSEGVAQQIKVRVFAYSLGSGPGLRFALHELRVDRVVLGAPFTSLRDMARHRMGSTVAMLLSEDYNNVGALKKLLERNPKPAVTIISGTADESIPHSHSLSLAGVDREWIRHIPVAGADHVSIWALGEKQMVDALK